MSEHVVVLVTCGKRAEAKRIARAAVEAYLAACVNVLQAPLDSTYRWKGKVETAREFLLLMKSSKRRLVGLRALVEHMHSYEVPEFIALPFAAGSSTYLRWLEEGLQPAEPPRKPR
jgi:periplasmic divalent cation tolerance protein